jgi:proteic killer suppression protein
MRAFLEGFNGNGLAYKRTRDLATGKRVRPFTGIEQATLLKLDRLEAAVDLRDLAALPGNRFEALEADRKGQYSILIHDQWRICFEWPNASFLLRFPNAFVPLSGRAEGFIPLRADVAQQ